MVPSITYAVFFSLSRTTMSGLCPLLGMYSASAGRPKIFLLSSFPLLLWDLVAGTMVASSVGLIDRIFLGEGS